MSLLHALRKLAGAWQPGNTLPDNAHHAIATGEAHYASKRLDAALASYEHAIALEPAHAEAHNKRAGVLRDQGKLEDALASCEHAITLKPAYAQAHNTRGNILWDMQRTDDALASYDRALAFDPGLVWAHINRGNLLQSLKQFDLALASHEQAVAVAPNRAAAYLNRGDLLLELQRTESALDDFNKAIALDSGYADAHTQRGRALHHLMQHEAALESYDCAITLAPASPDAHSNRGLLLLDMLRPQEALQSFDRAVAADQQRASMHNNRGIAYYHLQDPATAVKNYDQAIGLDPEFLDAGLNKSLALLLAGDFAKGWACFERRTAVPHLFATQLRYPFWNGNESLSGKVILLRAEQGLGDTVQFCRYAQAVSNLGAKVILEVQPALKHLLYGLAGTYAVIAQGEQHDVQVNYQCALMSLPYMLGTTLENIPNTAPYIACDGDKVAFWRDRLAPVTSPKVGLVWSGGHRADRPELKAVHHRRNLTLDCLAPLKSIPATFVSLQKGEPAESELRDAIARNWDGPPIVTYAHEWHDFSDTAALMQNLDLIISVDTSTAHLAGALGKPVWLLNRYDTCWRWMLDRSDSPWYPSMTIYRQEKPGDWVSVVQRVAHDLAGLIRNP